jgi:hypothetical protein
MLVAAKNTEEESCLTIVYDLLENLLDRDPQMVSNKVMANDKLIIWVLEEMKNIGSDDTYLTLCQIFSTIIQSCSNDYKSKFVLVDPINGLEQTLDILNTFRT